MTLARKIFSNTAWQIAGKLVTAVLGIISIKYITNYLSRSDYGEYTTIYDYTALFAIIADFGLFTIAVREMAHNNTKNAVEKIVGNVLSVRLVLAVMALGLAVLIASFLPAFRGSHIPLGVLLVSAATLITLIAGTMSSVLQFYLRMHWASVALTLGKIVTVGYIVAVILFIFPGQPAEGFPHLLFAWIFGGLVTIFITFLATRRLVPIRFQFDFVFWKTVLIKALPFGAALVLGTMYFRMGTIVMSFFQMKDDVGAYGVPLRFLEILQIVPHYFMNSVLPVLTISLKEGGERTKRILGNSLNALAALAFPIFVGGYLLAWPLTAAVSSEKFLTARVSGVLVWGSDMALKILLIGMVFTFLHVALSYALVAMGQQAELLWMNAVTVIANISLNLLLVPKFGFIGAAVSAAAAEFVMFIFLAWRIRQKIAAAWDFSFLAKTVFSSAVMGAVLLAIGPPLQNALFTKSLFILIPLGTAVFFGVMVATRGFTRDMLTMLRKTEPPMMEE